MGAAPTTTGPPDGNRAAADLRELLRDLGAGEYVLTRITRWADLGTRGYVYVPPLPADVVDRLVRLRTPEARA
jgi:hypothetical protein